MADQGSSEKTESPTHKKREDARKEGQVAFSKEVSSTALLGSFILIFYFGGNIILNSFQESLAFSFNNLNIAEITIPLLQRIFNIYLNQSSILIIPFFLTAFIVGLLASALQVGINVTLKPLMPNFEKISPLKGIGRMFSKMAINELFKSVFKMTVIMYIGYYTFTESLGELINLVDSDVQSIVNVTFTVIATFVFRLFLAFLILSLIDYAFQRWQLEEKLKMSKQDLKEELKQAEGDPQIKARIRQVQQQLSQARMMQEVPKADVVISNPTHFAIALKYDRDVMSAPEVIAKGMDFIALRIIEIATENKVIVYQSPQMARSLYYQVEIGDKIPEEFYKAIAEIIAFVYRTKQKESRYRK